MNGILLVDKPAGWTSHDVVAKLRGLLHERKIGHSGTLDPMATGLLVVFLGRATRAVEFAEADRKEYAAGIRFGVSTDTQDTTGNVLEEHECSFTTEELDRVLESFRGDIMQVPPMYSAIKVNGKKLYELARRGGEVEREARPVSIYTLERSDVISREMTLRVECSKGTYIRTLCHDIGQALGCGACMSSLRRTRAGRFSLEQAHTLEEISRMAEAGCAESLLLSTDALFGDCERYMLSTNQEKCLRNGGQFSTDKANGKYRAYAADGSFIALTEVSDGVMRSIKSFYEV